MRPIVLFIASSTLFACVTVQGDRHVLGQRKVETHCDAGRPIASIDSTRRDRIRLVFDRVDTCTDVYEIRHATDMQLQLSEPARIALAIAAGAAVAVPLVAIATAISPKGDDARYQGTTANAASEAIGRAIVLPIILAGTVVYGWTGRPLPLPPVEKVETLERDARVQTGEIAVRAGRVQGAGIADRVLVRGVLDLTFEEGLALDPKTLTLDGQAVEVRQDLLERFSILALCRNARTQTDPGTQFRMANACDAHGWGFADDVLAQGAHQLPVPPR